MPRRSQGENLRGDARRRLTGSDSTSERAISLVSGNCVLSRSAAVVLIADFAPFLLILSTTFEVGAVFDAEAKNLAARTSRRVQLRVDRQFNRARYDADQTVAAFAARLKDTVDLESVRDDLAGVAYAALEPVHVSVWINEHA